MEGGVIALCFVALCLQLGMGSNTNIPDDEDYDYSGSGSGSEPGNIVTIQTVESTVTVGAGDSYTLNCTVVSDFHPAVNWIDPDGNPVNGSGVAIDEPVYHHKTTYMLLRFHSVHTSQAGRYTCQSTVRSNRTATIDVVVIVPAPSVHIVRTPSTGVNTTTLLNLTCITVMIAEVDTPMTVIHSWRGPSGSIFPNSSHPSVYNVTRDGKVYRSTVLFSSGMQTSDTGTYYCITDISSASSYIVVNSAVQASTHVAVALKVVIDISYTPPEPGYQPPYYRTASGVTLTCRAVGGTGQIRYLWTTTCNDCFVPNGTYFDSYGTVSRIQDFLRSRDAGTHTCSALDSHGFSDSASIVMNIVGAGIHVTNSELSYSSSSLPNNSIILVNTDTHSSYSRYRRMGFYCCSNFTPGYSDIGTFIGVDGIYYYGKIRVNHYYYTTSPYAGCMYIYLDQSYYSQKQLSSSEEGIYTCRMNLGRSGTSDVNIGIY